MLASSPLPARRWLALLAASWLLGSAGDASAHHRGLPALTDDPAGEAAGATSLTDQARARTAAGPSGSPAAAAVPRAARNLSLVSSLALDPVNVAAHADVAGYRDLAFVGKWRESCPGTGVDVIDISDPAAPRKVSDTFDHPNTSMEDMEAMRIGGRDVLATGLQDCAGAGLEPGLGALELHDVSDPANPAVLSLLPVDAGGVHELDLTRTRDGRTLALLAVPGHEALTSDEAALGGLGDLLIVDITDPARPAILSDFGVLDEPALGVGTYLGSRQGNDARTYGHSVRANGDATIAHISYWDSGVVSVDISDPRNPVYLGRTTFAAGEEGNAHSIDTARGGDVLVQADEDYTPYRSSFTSSAFGEDRTAVESSFTPPVAESEGRALTGEVVHVGRGCPADSVAPGTPADPYLADPAGRIALVERGGCRFDFKVARAQLAGATGVLVYNTEAGGEELIAMGGTDPVTLPDGTGVDIAIPAFFVPRSTGVLLRDGSAPVTVRLGQVFDGWGFLRFWDVRDPAQPAQIGRFATTNTLSEAALSGAGDAWFTAHNPEVRGNRLYASWYADGVRLVDITTASRPREVGYWTGAGAPADAPPVDIWSAVPHRDLLLASDRNHGLYILRDTYLRPAARRGG